MSGLNESTVEDAALIRLGELGYAVGHGPHLAPGEPTRKRDSFSEVVLVGRLREAVRRLNPAIPEQPSAGEVGHTDSGQRFGRIESFDWNGG